MTFFTTLSWSKYSCFVNRYLGSIDFQYDFGLVKQPLRLILFHGDHNDAFIVIQIARRLQCLEKAQSGFLPN